LALQLLCAHVDRFHKGFGMGSSSMKIRKKAGYKDLLTGIVELLENARRSAARSIDSIMTVTYWDLGRRIVDNEQHGKRRADYGKKVIENLSNDLTARFGRGFGQRNIEQMRRFYLTWTIPQSSIAELSGTTDIASHFPLPWTAYVRLLSVTRQEAREFYESEAIRGGWTIKQLERQIGSQFYERSLLSIDKASAPTRGEQKTKPTDILSPEEEIKNPYRLEFLGLKDEYSESQLEEALILHLEGFLLELGGDFTFVGRQKRLRVGDEWYRVDLVFFHRKLRCLVLIDLKLDRFTHADAGQMNLYCNYARRHWTNENENPPVGLILCAGKNQAVAEYALEGISNKILTSEYQTALPTRKTLEDELRKTRKVLERRSKFR
jgi:predicted nuclease of restriction endonuclease-like (RecB) superfamily